MSTVRSTALRKRRAVRMFSTMKWRSVRTTWALPAGNTWSIGLSDKTVGMRYSVPDMSLMLFLYVGQFETVAFAAVFDFEPQAEYEGDYAEGGEDNHTGGIVVHVYVVGVEGCSVEHTVFDLFGSGSACFRGTGVGGSQYVAYDFGYEAESDVLYPEDE